MDGVPEKTPARARVIVRRAARRAMSVAAWLTATAIPLGLVGQLARDRAMVLSLMMYVPLAPVGAAAVLVDLLLRGRALGPRLVPRFTLSAAGVVALVIGIVPMLGLRRPQPPAAGGVTLTLLHWNVQWGGRRAAESDWQRSAKMMLSRHPDVIVLSEAPHDQWLSHSLETDAGEWRTVQLFNEPGSRYWYRMQVCSPWPVHLEKRVPVRNGAAMTVTVEVKGTPVRLLVGDGMSSISMPRVPFLYDVARACEDAAGAGAPYDVIVGDFNSVGRSIGFDAVRSAAGGYGRASDFCDGWRATWPAPLPVYDIDHVMPHAGVAVAGCEVFSSDLFDTDHRGQFVMLALPPSDGRSR